MSGENVLNVLEQTPGPLGDNDNAARFNGTLQINTPVLGADGMQAGAITDPTGGATVDAEARAAIDDILAALRNAGIIDT